MAIHSPQLDTQTRKMQQQFEWLPLKALNSWLHSSPLQMGLAPWINRSVNKEEKNPTFSLKPNGI